MNTRFVHRQTTLDHLRRRHESFSPYEFATYGLCFVRRFRRAGFCAPGAPPTEHGMAHLLASPYHLLTLAVLAWLIAIAKMIKHRITGFLAVAGIATAGAAALRLDRVVVITAIPQICLPLSTADQTALVSAHPLLFLVLLAASAPPGMKYPPEICDEPQRKLKWVREDRSAWRITNGLLEVRVQPGICGGRPTTPKTSCLFLRREPRGWRSRPQSNTAQPIITSRPTWSYHADGNMVKLGPELVDGRFSVVMGRKSAIAPAPFRSTRSPSGRGREVYRQGKRDQRSVSRQSQQLAERRKLLVACVAGTGTADQPAILPGHRACRALSACEAPGHHAT